ncbi:PWWP domain-containing DNA repair factor 3A-like isoform X2 [Takifugu rubripes]|uniref:PWWP domain-containing DNA repair factor 3A-like isoform X2 n=1 Tax=Takifugu rubripes TaxID=31033 RepID=UPI001145E50D|nr:PWWP domain-containing DNA repair factor 3A-like isoform X2 [Takifugu rubripes]
MKGGSLKTRSGICRKAPAAKNAPDVRRNPEVNGLPDCAMVNQLSASPLLSTPKRSRRIQQREAGLTSTPVKSFPDVFSNIAETLSGPNPVELEYTEHSTQSKPSDLDSACTKSVWRGRHSRTLTSKLKQRQRKNKTKACRKNSSLSDTPSYDNQEKNTGATSAEPEKYSRRKSDLKIPEEDSPLSSSLSMQLSHQEEQLHTSDLNCDEDEKQDEEDEDLPSFLENERKPTPIRQGMFVWYKLRKFPFWPSWVKSVNHKQKKASVLFIDNPKIYTRKGFAVALKALKPFDCEEFQDLESQAKENYQDIIVWSLELISDYRMRIACRSFSGSFIEYCAHDMSHPVMKTFPQGVSVSPTVTSNEAIEPLSREGEDKISEPQEDTSRTQKRLLPDRSHAAHDRANEKLVNFIVKQRMAEERLLAVIHGHQQSSWYQHFQKARGRRVVNTYLEDQKQLDEVYCYLNELYTTAAATTSSLRKLKFIDLVTFILDVLLPEAIISAIAGVDKISLQKAEEKFLRGRSISARESQELNVMIERYMQSK